MTHTPSLFAKIGVLTSLLLGSAFAGPKCEEVLRLFQSTLGLAPKDNLARLAAAEHFESVGETEIATFIRMAIVALDPNDPSHADAKRMAEDLRPKMDERIRAIAPSGVTWSWERGFLGRVEVQLSVGRLTDAKWRAHFFEFMNLEGFAANLHIYPPIWNLGTRHRIEAENFIVELADFARKYKQDRIFELLKDARIYPQARQPRLLFTARLIPPFEAVNFSNANHLNFLRFLALQRETDHAIDAGAPFPLLFVAAVERDFTDGITRPTIKTCLTDPVLLERLEKDKDYRAYFDRYPLQSRDFREVAFSETVFALIREKRLRSLEESSRPRDSDNDIRAVADLCFLDFRQKKSVGYSLEKRNLPFLAKLPEPKLERASNTLEDFFNSVTTLEIGEAAPHFLLLTQILSNHRKWKKFHQPNIQYVAWLNGSVEAEDYELAIKSHWATDPNSDRYRSQLVRAAVAALETAKDNRFLSMIERTIRDSESNSEPALLARAILRAISFDADSPPRNTVVTTLCRLARNGDAGARKILTDLSTDPSYDALTEELRRRLGESLNTQP